MSAARKGSLLAALTMSPGTTWSAHRDAAQRLRDLRICQAWHPGRVVSKAEDVLLSVNEYRPHTLRDVITISRLAVALVDDVVALDDAVGIVAAYEPRRRITFSLSVWRSEEALLVFTMAPAHREIMNSYRRRGYLRHVHWWGTHRSVGASLAEATRRLDRGEGRRTGDARDRWARADQERLATLGATPARPIWASKRTGEKRNVSVVRSNG